HPAGNDPWNARTLEWATPSPVPFYDFTATPVVRSRDAFWEMKTNGRGELAERRYEDIELSKNTGMAIYLSGLLFLFGFAMVWHITWLAIVGLAGAVLCVIIRSFDEHTEYVLPAAEIKRRDMARQRT